MGEPDRNNRYHSNVPHFQANCPSGAPSDSGAPNQLSLMMQAYFGFIQQSMTIPSSFIDPNSLYAHNDPCFNVYQPGFRHDYVNRSNHFVSSRNPFPQNLASHSMYPENYFLPGTSSSPASNYYEDTNPYKACGVTKSESNSLKIKEKHIPDQHLKRNYGPSGCDRTIRGQYCNYRQQSEYREPSFKRGQGKYNCPERNSNDYGYGQHNENSNSPKNTNKGKHENKREMNFQEQRERNEWTRKDNLKQEGRTQRESMIDLLTAGVYECVVCCEAVKQQHAIWSCKKCFNCFHLICIKKWAGTSKGEPGWRCPVCQNLNSKIPSAYFCFCMKMREPQWHRREIPHSCGEVCGLQRANEWCTHKCTSLCHPGPCPDCSAFIRRSCACGKNTKAVKCSVLQPYLCEEKCLKPLNCGIHECQNKCHIGACASCEEIIRKECYCGKECHSVKCQSESVAESSYSCKSLCNKMLTCQQHKCPKECHSGTCDPCDRAVEIVKNCPCGKMNLNEFYKKKGISPRAFCTDIIPTCGEICDKLLKCGTPGSYHSCQDHCHEGVCLPCNKETAVRCRCGFMSKNILCAQLNAKADEVTCEKQCKKMRQCGRHKCGVKCCIDVDHICTRICGRLLKCRLHKCQDHCHRGNCSRCWETGFEELTCHCGASVKYPPIPCGTEPPLCDKPCRRLHACSHDVSHNCHSDPTCPPCTMLIRKPCFGKHTIMKSTPCYINAMSCGKQCATVLPCGFHKCQKVCHDGECSQGNKCNQLCSKSRSACGHPCGSPCHSGPCPYKTCKVKVTVTCLCGNVKVEMPCWENDREYKALESSKLASSMQSGNPGESINISHLFIDSNKANIFKRLDCNEECGRLERNRKLALALQISNPDARQILGENTLYSESMKEEAKKDLKFASFVHDTLNDLVLRSKESKHKMRCHSFDPMNRDKRRFIHEYAQVFGCESQAYDEEPKKNVIVTASKALSRVPPVSVVTVVQREQGQRKGPGPVLSRKEIGSEKNYAVMKRLEKSNSLEEKERPSDGVPGTNIKHPIDYFDFS